MHEIIVGAIASLVSSIIWFCGGRLIMTRKSREKISFLLDRLYDCVDQFDTAMTFELVDTAETQTDQILEFCARIKDEMMPWTFIGNKKKLFNSVLYNLYYTTSHYKRLWVGYNGDVEKVQILRKFKRKYYYAVPIYSNDANDEAEERSFMIFSVTLMQALNAQNSVTNALCHNYFVNKEWNTNIKDTYAGLIAPLNFKSSTIAQRYDLRKNMFTKDEYESYISKKLRRISHEHI